MGCSNQQPEVVAFSQDTKDCSCTPPRSSSAFMVNSEIGAVLAVMRRNVRWGFHYTTDEDQLDHPLIKSFKEIRKQVFSWQHQWHTISPVVYLQPFLDVIQSDETSAPITGVALSSIYKFLTLEVLDLGTINVADALHLIVDAVTSCRFEVTDPASEEVVLMKILQVLLACMKSKASVNLSNQHVCNIVNTCFQIVHQASSKGELLQRTARHTMHELIRCIFMHLPDDCDNNQDFTQRGKSHLGDEISVPDNDNSSSSKPQDNGYTGSKIESVGNPLNLSIDMPEVKMNHETTGEVDQSENHLVVEHYGVACMVEIFSFLCSLLNAVEYVGVGPRSNSLAYDEDVPLFAFGLINSAIELSGPSLGHHPEMLALVQNDLFHSLMQFGLSPSPLILSTVCSIVLNLYHLMRAKLKLQLEAFFSCVLMKIAVNKHGASYQQQEVAMETLVDLCRQPGFIHEMYANYDCDISCSNLFEDLANLLSKSAFPVNSPLSAIHVLALEGLIAMISGMAETIGDRDQIPVLEPDASNLEDHESFWNVKCESYENPKCWVPYIHKMKHVKKKLMIGVDHFNRDPKKGFQFLQGCCLLPETLDPLSVACFLRYTNGLDKNLVGEYFGNHDQFCVDVLQEYAKTFDFREMNLDIALRVFLETFRLPGESQKIQRVVEAFAERYYEQSPDIFANKDAALLLSYSLIMLNTDQHNAQVKKKMTEDDFIRNNRLINGGKDIPREYLSELYHSICENEIRMTQGIGLPVMTHDNWVGLIHKSRQTAPFIICGSGEQINNKMFAILSGPTVAALSVVLDLVDQEAVLQTCIDGFLNVAKIAGCYHLDDVLDGLLVSLSKFTTLLLPMSIEESVLAFGHDSKAQKSTLAVFTIANMYGDYIRLGWRNILDCILSLHKLGLLPAHLARDAADDMESNSEPDSVRSSLVSPVKPALPPARKSFGLMGRFSEFLYYDTEKSAPQPSEEEVEARKRATETVKDCHIDTVFAESKFLQSESLLNLSRALILASHEDENGAVFCLELLITVTLNNRDRIMLLWQNVYEYIANIVQSAVMPSTLVEKSVFGLIRICRRLLPYKEELTDDLLKSLQLVLKLDARVADAYCEHITREIMRLVKANAGQIKSHLGWRTITSLLSITARHPEASEPGFELLEFIMLDGAHLLPANFVLCVNAARQFAESRVDDVARSIKSLDLMAGSSVCLVKWSREMVGEEPETAVQLYQDIGEMWVRLAQALRKVCIDSREELRNHAVLMLQQCLTGLEGIILQDEMWVQCFDSVIFPLLSDLLDIVEERSAKEYRNMEGTLILSLKLLSKSFLHSLPHISRSVSFSKIWLGVLSCMERYTKVKFRGKRSERIYELVPELLKNTLFVMKSTGVLSPNGSDGLWEQTWLHVRTLAPSVQSEVFPNDEPLTVAFGVVPEANLVVP